MWKVIQTYFPDPKAYRVYVEPFGGSGAMLLSQPLGHVEIYNDLYKNVFSLYKTLADPAGFAAFKARADLALYSEDLRKEAKEKLLGELSEGERAFYYWYFNRTSHNGIGGLSVNGCIRRNMSKSTSDFLSCIDRLKELHDRLSAVIILNRDALEVMKQYDASNTFYYLDPPYSWETRGSTRYAVDFSPAQQVGLVDSLLTAKAQVLVSGYANQEYTRLERAGWQKIDFDKNTIGGGFKPKTVVESLWRNYGDKAGKELL